MESVLTLHGRQDIKVELWDSLAANIEPDLSKYAAIYIGGGNTWNLTKELAETNFVNNLNIFLAKGGMVYGGSAGAIILGKRIDTQEDKNLIGWTATNGFSLVGDYSFACHFKEDQLERYRAWAQSHQLPIICLPEDGGVISNAGKIHCASSVPCFVCLPDGTYKKLINGEEIAL